MKRIKTQRGPAGKGSATLGSSNRRYVASKKLAEDESKEATARVIQKVNKAKQPEAITISPDKNIVGQGVQQSI